ncbi:MAG: tRNA lysidine(34) synthetase TilS [Magnetovibrio sp.]|nr:tRNA lysidine(34) synthetase TilS [Magnetovibrio sp.]
MPDDVSAAKPVSPQEFSELMAACWRIGDGARIAVAVSGGADSMALCLLLKRWGDETGVQLSALTVDHGLRNESAAEAEQVASWLRVRGIDHHILNWTDKPKTRIQERARKARYDLMQTWCVEHGIDNLFVAHHLEDQAETMLMRLKKRTGLLGLAGMSARREGDKIDIIRPLLSISKARLLASLENFGQDWVEDPSNQNPAYERVRTRQLLKGLAREGVDAERLGGTAYALGRLRRTLARHADGLIANATLSEKPLRLDYEIFVQAPETLQEIALGRVLRAIGGQDYVPAPAKVERLCMWLRATGQVGPIARTLGGCEVRRMQKGGVVSIQISPEGPRGATKRAQNKDKNCESGLAPRA